MNKEEIKVKILELKNNAEFMAIYNRYNSNCWISPLEFKKIKKMINEKWMTVDEFNKNIIEIL